MKIKGAIKLINKLNKKIMIMLKKFKSIYKLLLISIFATFTVASSANSIELEGKNFIIGGIQYSNGTANSNHTNGRKHGNLIDGNDVTIGIGHVDQIKGFRVDWSFVYSPHLPGGLQSHGTKCPNVTFNCDTSIDEVYEFGSKIYLNTKVADYVPALYLGLSSAKIGKNTCRNPADGCDTGSAVDRVTGHAYNIGASMTKMLLNDYELSFDYKYTMIDNELTITSPSGQDVVAKPEYHTIGISLKKFF